MKKLFFLFLFLLLNFSLASASITDAIDSLSFNSVSNPYADDGSNAFTFSDIGGNAPTQTAGVGSNYYMQFDGANDGIQTTSDINYNAVSVWFNADTAKNQRIWNKDFTDGSTRDSYVDLLSNGNIYVAYHLNTGFNADGTIPYNTSQWYHLVTQFNASSQQIEIFVNGVLKSSYGSGSSVTNTNNKFQLGQRNSGTIFNAFDGSIDQVIVYDRILSTSEIIELYDSGIVGYDPYAPQGGFTHNITGGYLTPNASVYTDASNLRGNIFVNSTADVYVNYSYLVNDVEVVTGLYTGSPVGNSFVLPVLSNTNFNQEDVVNFTAVLVNQSNTSLEVSPRFYSDGVTIINRVPTGDIEWSTRTPLNDSNFSAFLTPGDSDLDNINISWNLFKNDVLDSSGSELNVAYPYGTIELFTVDASTTLPGDNYSFNVSIFDGYDYYVSDRSVYAEVTDSANFTITVNNEWSGLPVQSFNYEIYGLLNYSQNATDNNTNSKIFNLFTDYRRNATILWNKTEYLVPESCLNDYYPSQLNMNAFSFGNGFLSCLSYSSPSTATTIFIADGFFDNVSAVFYGPAYFSSNTSSKTTYLISNRTVDIVISSNNYFPITYTNWNLSENLFAELNQSRISFAATALTSGTTVNNLSFSVGGSTRDLFPLSVGDHTVIASGGNWTGSKTFSVTALDIKTETVNVSDTTLILGVSNYLTGNYQSGTKTGWYYNELYDKNYSFSFSTDTTNISLEQGLTYEFYLDVPSGFADNIGVAFNYTPSSSVANRNFTLYEAKTLEVFLFNTDANVHTNETTIRVENNLIAYQTTTTSGSYYLNPIIPGNYTVTITSEGYNTVYRYVSIGSTEYTPINVFMTQGGKLVTFSVIDNLGDAVDQAIIGLSYFVNGTQVFIGQRQTDLSGSAQIIVNENITYVVTASKDGYKTFSGSLTPFQTSYIINLDSDALNQFTSIFTDVSYRTALQSYNNKSWAYATFDVVSATGTLRSFGMSTNYRGTTYSTSLSSNPNGGNLFFNITNINRSEESELIITYYLIDNTGERYEWNETYLLQGTYDGDNIINVDLKNLPAGVKAFISALIIGLLAILGSMLSGRMIGGVIGGLMGVAFAIIVNLLTLIPGLLTVGVLLILIITDMRTGENR